MLTRGSFRGSPGGCRAAIALLVIVLFLIAGLIIIRIAVRSWRRMDDYLRLSVKGRENQVSAWEASAQRIQDDQKSDGDESDSDFGPGTSSKDDDE